MFFFEELILVCLQWCCMLLLFLNGRFVYLGTADDFFFKLSPTTTPPPPPPKPGHAHAHAHARMSACAAPRDAEVLAQLRRSSRVGFARAAALRSSVAEFGGGGGTTSWSAGSVPTSWRNRSVLVLAPRRSGSLCGILLQSSASRVSVHAPRHEQQHRRRALSTIRFFGCSCSCVSPAATAAATHLATVAWARGTGHGARLRRQHRLRRQGRW